MDTVKLCIGFVVMKNGDPVRTGSSYSGVTAKVYPKIGTAKSVAKKRDAVVYATYIEVTEKVFHETTKMET